MVGGALLELVDTVFSDFISSQGVISALSDAAGELATAAVQGNLDAVLPRVQEELRENPDVDAAVQVSVGTAVATFLGDAGVLSAVDAALSLLVGEVIADTAVQDAVGDRVAGEVNSLLGFGPISVVGDDVGDAVVALLSDPVVSGALVELVDTVFSDFFGASGVADAFGAAAGDVALAVLTGESLSAATQDALSALDADPDVDAAVQASVGDAVTQFLGDTDVWLAVDAGVNALLTRLITDPVARSALSDRVADAVSIQLGGGDLGEVVGAQVAATVLGLLTDPVVGGALLELVDTVFSDFISSQGVISALSDAAGELATAAVQGNLDAVLPRVQEELRENPDVDAAVQVSVGTAVATFLGDAGVLSAVDAALSLLVGEVIADTAVQDAVGDRVAGEVNSLLGFGPISVVGDDVGDAVVALLSDPVVSGALVELVDTVFSDFFGASGVADAFGAAAGDVALAVLTGESLSAATQDALSALDADPDVDAAVQASVGDAVTQFLGDTEVWLAVGDSLTTLVTSLVGETVVQQYAGEQVAALVARALAPTPIAPIAAQVGDALGAAVQQFLGTAGVAPALGAIIGALLPDFLSQPGVSAEIGEVTGQFAEALVTSTNPTQARQDAIAALTSSPVIRSGAKAVIADALDMIDTTLLSDLATEQAIGSIVTTLITDLATDPVVQTFIEGQLGPTLGPVIAGLLADTPVVDGIAALLGNAVAEALGYPGFSTALTGAAGQVADAVIDGADAGVAVQSALRSLQASPAFIGAANAIVPPTVNAILAYPEVRQTIGDAAQQEAIAALRRIGIDNRFLDAVAGQVAEGTAEALLAKNAARELIDTIAVKVVLGMPLSDVTGFAAEEVIRSLPLQLAVGFSVGQGIGSLFGDNIIGDVIGLAAAFPATIVVSVTAGIVGFFQLIFGAPNVDPSRVALAAQAAPDGMAGALVAGSPLTSATGSDGGQQGSIDITLRSGTAGAPSAAPTQVAFRFRIDELISAPQRDRPSRRNAVGSPFVER